MMILGIDEVGRGAVAGPVMLSGVFVSSDFPLLCSHFSPQEPFWDTGYTLLKQLRDSKKLKQDKRELIYEYIIEQKIPSLCLQATAVQIDKWGVGVCLGNLVLIIITYFLSQQLIEPLQIIIDGQIKLPVTIDMEMLQELLELNNLSISQQELEDTLQLINKINQTNQIKNKSSQQYGLFDDELSDKQQAWELRRENFADDKYLSVALASNFAKVIRDRLMSALDSDYPLLGWSQNKGYGTKNHLEAIKKMAQKTNCPYLRQSYLKKVLN
jgi:ribonuclease HII